MVPMSPGRGNPATSLTRNCIFLRCRALPVCARISSITYSDSACMAASSGASGSSESNRNCFN